MAHYECNLETRNRFEPDNRFIGDIEDGKRYPYGVYTKCEADARFLKKSEVPEIPEIEEELEKKADKETVALLTAVVETKASIADVQGLQPKLSESNKLNPEYIEYNSTHATVTNTEKTSWNEKVSARIEGSSETLVLY